MLESKLYTALITVTLLIAATAVVFQVLEMKEYSLFETLF